jgi:hypothetical protein
MITVTRSMSGSTTRSGEVHQFLGTPVPHHHAMPLQSLAALDLFVLLVRGYRPFARSKQRLPIVVPLLQGDLRGRAVTSLRLLDAASAPTGRRGG